MPDTFTRSRSRLTQNSDDILLVGGRKIIGQFYRNFGTWIPLKENDNVTIAPYRVVPTDPYIAKEVTYDSIHKGPPWTDGGAFLRILVSLPSLTVQGIGEYMTVDEQISDFTGTHPWRYVGGFTNPSFIGDPFQGQYADPTKFLPNSPFVPSMSAYGPRVYPSLRPKLEKAGMAVAIAESRDIPRMLKTTAAGFDRVYRDIIGHHTPRGAASRLRHNMPKWAADQFLNYQFGWIPFLNDLQKFYTVYQNAAAYKSRLTHENNRWVKRKWTFDENTTSVVTASGTDWRCEPFGNTISTMMVPGAGGVRTTWQQFTDTVYRTSAVGRFKYYRPEFDDSDLQDYNSAWNTIQRQLTMYGARISPSNVYKATPWTWLIDWFSSTGDQILAAQDYALDGVVSKYMFLMRSQSDVIRLQQKFVNKLGSVPVTCEWSRLIQTKHRSEADSPYGFSLSWDSLTPRQLAILASLGITRH